MKKRISLLLLIAVGFVGSMCAQNVARVGDTEYAAFRDACSAVPSGGTITMLASTTVTGYMIEVGKAFTLDLNGYTITSGTSDGSGSLFQVNGGGDITITDSSANQDGAITCVNKNNNLIIVILSGGNLTMEAGHIESPSSLTKGCCAISISDANSSLIVNGGVLTTAKGNTESAVGVIFSKGTVVINGGLIQNTLSGSTSASRGINNAGSLTVNGGTIVSSENAIWTARNKTLVLGSGANIRGAVYMYNNLPLQEYILDDNASLNLTNSLTASKVSYNRGNSNAFGTVCLPFVPDAKATVTYYTLREATESTLTLEQVDSPVANTPYIYYTEDGTFNVCRNASTTLAANPTAGIVEKGDWALNGVYRLMLVFDSDDDTGYDANNAGHVLKPNSYYIKDNAFCKGNGYFSVKPFRAYITNQGGAGSSRYDISLLDDATAVSPIAGDGQEVVAIRDLQGVSLGKLQRGVNIVTFADGQTKKVLVK